MNYTAALLLIAALFPSVASFASAPGLPPKPAPVKESSDAPVKPIDDKAAKELLESLASLEKLLDAKRMEKNKEAFTAFTEASTSDDKAHDLFIKCKRKVDFEDKGRESEWSDWKSSPQGKAAHDQEHCLALRFQLQWLLLTIRASNASTDSSYGEVVKEIPAFLAAMLDKWKRMDRHRDSLRNDVVNSVFGRYFRLDQTLETRKGWVGSPGNMDEIYEGILLPYLRSQKNLAGLNTAWNTRIAQLTEILKITTERGSEAQLEFTNERLPTLQWSMARDNFILGNQNTASTQMMSILKANLGHRQAPRWISELTSLLKGEPLPGHDEEESPSSLPHSPPPPAPPTPKPGGGTLKPIDEPPATKPEPAKENDTVDF